MKSRICSAVLLLIMISGHGLRAQEVQARLDEASAYYRSEDLENARFTLQEALNEINQALGKEILGILPSDIHGMNRVDGEDEVTGVNTGFAGLFIHRSYKDESRSASVDIISDSPLMAGVNTILAMPGFMTSDPDQKRIKVNNYKALLTRSADEEGRVSYDVQVPLSSSLLTFQCSGIEDENEVIEMAGTIPVDRIRDISE